MATDVDGTLTDADGRLPAAVVDALAALSRAGVTVVAVTGRSAGWAQALATYLPGVVGVVAENGALWCPPHAAPASLDDRPLRATLADARRVAESVAAGAGVALGADNAFRLTDQTVDAGAGLGPAAVAEVARAAGLGHTWSSVHHHLSVSWLDKATGLLRVLARLGADPAATVTVGDSANDAPMLDPSGPWLATVAVADGVAARWRAKGFTDVATGCLDRVG